MIYEMTQQQYDRLLDAMAPVPMIALHLGSPRSLQQRANDAWEVLGNEMGFQHMTVRPSTLSPRHFTAEPKEVSHE